MPLANKTPGGETRGRCLFNSNARRRGMIDTEMPEVMGVFPGILGVFSTLPLCFLLALAHCTAAFARDIQSTPRWSKLAFERPVGNARPLKEDAVPCAAGIAGSVAPACG